jgi:hypothetical protein
VAVVVVVAVPPSAAADENVAPATPAVANTMAVNSFTLRCLSREFI